MQGTTRLPGHGDLARPLRVLVLAVAPARARQLPTSFFEKTYNLACLHADKFLPESPVVSASGAAPTNAADSRRAVSARGQDRPARCSAPPAKARQRLDDLIDQGHSPAQPRLRRAERVARRDPHRLSGEVHVAPAQRQQLPHPQPGHRGGQAPRPARRNSRARAHGPPRASRTRSRWASIPAVAGCPRPGSAAASTPCARAERIKSAPARIRTWDPRIRS